MTARVPALGSVLRRGAALSVLALGAVQVITFGQTLVLARLLTPAEVGAFAAGTALGLLLMVLAEGALTQALIQRDGDVRDAADTVFWATLAGAVLAALAVLAAAPLVTELFDDPAAGAVAAATAGALVLHSLTHVPEALMQRRLDFRRRIVVDPIGALVFAVVAVAMSATGWGVWALVVAQYAMVSACVLAGWVLSGWRPGRGRFSPRLWWAMASYGYPLVLGSLVERGRDVLEIAVVGRALDASAVGNYRYGRRIAVLPATVVVEAGGFVLFPAFARLAGDPERIREAFLRALTWIWFLALPVAAALAVCGEALAVLLLGEPWRGAGVVLTAMAGFGLGQAVTAVVTEVMKGVGRSVRINWMTGAGLVSGVGLLIVLVPWGLPGVGLAVSGAAIVVALTGLAMVRSVVGVSGRALAARMLPATAAAVVAAVAVGFLERTIVRADTWPVPAGLGLVAAETLLLGAIYLAALHVVAPGLARAVRDAARVWGKRAKQS
ncbi:oligosaccharide flippase family protein [Pseudonocardia sp. DSM 110487]|uniref:oligosaccharide flippase family protein n=1 Tax=Pseudonocardia sp. DSM 110487 TaxID=2865833 RepID=UPI001C6A090D|nr:oligosaccharide flippase family protein [Pseudonocardia sp. DSM 110487]QYN34473.1 oligosaccharide flippase family protein [Pseudonocardia sp. DSM 110487]